MKKRCHQTIKYNFIKSTTCELRMQNHKFFKQCSIKLPKLESVFKMFDFSKRVRVLIKRYILKPEVKIHSKIEKMFHKKPYVFMWNVHPQ